MTYTNDKYIDLHIHLDGTITVEMAKRLAELQNIELPTSDDKELMRLLRIPEVCTSLDEFLSCFELPLKLLQSYEGISEAAYLMAEDFLAQNIVYAEVRFAPQLHTRNGLTQEETLKAVLEGLSRSSAKVNIILILMRGEGIEAENAETLELAKKYLVEDGGVVAIDLAGAEAQYPTENFKELLCTATEYGIPLTVHAGEAAGAESVRLAVEYGARRIGHGIRASEDESVLELLTEKGIFLEMCPTSNRMTRTVDDMTKYPIMDYMAKGIKVTINTDDPALEGTVIGNEYSYIDELFGLTEEQKKTLLKNSVDAAFTSESVRAELRAVLGI